MIAIEAKPEIVLRLRPADRARVRRASLNAVRVAAAITGLLSGVWRLIVGVYFLCVDARPKRASCGVAGRNNDAEL